MSVLASLGSLCQHVGHTTGIVPSSGAPRIRGPLGLQGMTASFFNGIVEGRERDSWTVIL